MPRLATARTEANRRADAGLRVQKRVVKEVSNMVDDGNGRIENGMLEWEDIIIKMRIDLGTSKVQKTCQSENENEHVRHCDD
jgi:hypothetical protein